MICNILNMILSFEYNRARHKSQSTNNLLLIRTRTFYEWSWQGVVGGRMWHSFDFCGSLPRRWRVACYVIFICSPTTIFICHQARHYPEIQSDNIFWIEFEDFLGFQVCVFVDLFVFHVVGRVLFILFLRSCVCCVNFSCFFLNMIICYWWW